MTIVSSSATTPPFSSSAISSSSCRSSNIKASTKPTLFTRRRTFPLALIMRRPGSIPTYLDSKDPQHPTDKRRRYARRASIGSKASTMLRLPRMSDVLSLQSSIYCGDGDGAGSSSTTHTSATTHSTYYNNNSSSQVTSPTSSPDSSRNGSSSLSYDQTPFSHSQQQSSTFGGPGDSDCSSLHVRQDGASTEMEVVHEQQQVISNDGSPTRRRRTLEDSRAVTMSLLTSALALSSVGDKGDAMGDTGADSSSPPC
jgi:hypothetical protein